MWISYLVVCGKRRSVEFVVVDKTRAWIPEANLLKDTRMRACTGNFIQITHEKFTFLLSMYTTEKYRNMRAVSNYTTGLFTK